MTVAAFPISTVVGIARGTVRRSRTGDRRRIRMFGQTKANRQSLSFAAAAARPVHLSGNAVALVARILDPDDPFGKAKPLPGPAATAPAVMGPESASTFG